VFRCDHRCFCGGVVLWIEQDVPKQGTKQMKHVEARKRRRKLANRIRRGEKPDEVAKREKVSYSTLYYSCKEHGVKMPKTARKNSSYAIIAELVNSGGSLRRIGKKVGVSFQFVDQVKRLAIEAGIPVRERKRK